MSTPLRVLIVEDSEDDVLLLISDLRQAGYDPTFERVDTATAMRAALANRAWDIVIADYALPQFSALAALALLHESGLDLPFIIVSGKIGEDVAVAAMRAGAHDYIMKGQLARLIPAIERELREARARAEHRRVEEQLRQAQKLEAVGRLAGGVAHDFSNVLTVIIGFSDVVLRHLLPGHPLRPYVEEIAKAGEHAAALTQQLLAFSRKQVLALEVLDVNAVVANTTMMLRRLIGEDIELVIRAEPGLGHVRADPTQLELVLMNLAVNARDAMPQGGKLIVETANVELGEAHIGREVVVHPGAYVMLAVSDTGCGMDEATQDRVFEPFFTTKEPGQGTGLSLATVYGIVKQSGGYIWVYSEPGHGTTFKIYLPRAGDGVAAPAAEAVPAPPTRGAETVLVVEDEAQVRLLVREVLETSGYTVLEASQGAEALALCEQHAGSIDLLLTDVVMPGMSGRELAEHLALLRPGLRTLYMSGYTDQAIVQHGLLEPGISLLQKPFTPDALAGKVREVLDAPRA